LTLDSVTSPVTPPSYTGHVMRDEARESPQIIDDEWVTFPGGELEGQPPRALCPACRDALKQAAGARIGAAGAVRPRRTLCFQCYRAGLDRDRMLKAAGTLDTASEARFQSLLPFEPVNRPRLAMLKAERSATRPAVRGAAAASADRRREAQIAARHALQAVASGLRERRLGAGERAVALAAAIHAAELQLPESWLPFVVSL
jgi:hypothetical protein